MTCLSFPYLSGKLINLRELTMDDATTIVDLMDYEIAKYLKEGVIPMAILKEEPNIEIVVSCI